MKSKLYAITFALLTLASSSASAAFQFTDWQVAGDKKAIIDSDTGIEWLRLTHTNRKSMSAITAELSSTYAGWRFPTNAEVTAMMSSIYNGISLQIHDIQVRGGNYAIGANRFIDLFVQGPVSKNVYSAGGLYRDEDNINRFFGSYVNENGDYTSTYGLEWSPTFCDTCTLTNNVGGVFLVSDGGTTLTSKNNPNINLNNPAAPINNVNAALGGLSALMLLLGIRRKHTTLEDKHEKTL